MDSLITSAAQALATGDVLGALKRVALRNDPAALALRGIAMAQLGDLERAKTLLREAADSFGANEPVARARCVVAEAEIALASRDLTRPTKRLALAYDTLRRFGDVANAVHARHLQARRSLLLGRLDEAEQLLVDVERRKLSDAARAIHELIVAGIAMRRVQVKTARSALDDATSAARRSSIASLMSEVELAAQALDAPAARRIQSDGEQLLRLADVEAVYASNAFIIDACRLRIRGAGTDISLARRPVLFALARALGEAWPADVSRETLIARAFRGRHADESYRARLRVEIGRLRRALRDIAGIDATPDGFVLKTRQSRNVIVLALPIEEKHAHVLALLVDGEAWSTSALALVLGASQRTVQRSLDALAANGKVQAFARGRARRWTTPPVPGFATTLLLPYAIAE